MLKSNDSFDFANILDTGMTASILGINYENYKINSNILKNQKSLETFNAEVLLLLKEIVENQKTIIGILKEEREKF